MIWNITVRYELIISKMPNMQVLCPYYENDDINKNFKKQCCIDRCVVLYFKFELNESILEQLIGHLFHTFLLLFHFQSKYGCPISSKITKLYFISNIIQLPRGEKTISNSVPLLNYPFNKLRLKLSDFCTPTMWSMNGPLTTHPVL